jgi:hypothetical protein
VSQCFASPLVDILGDCDPIGGPRGITALQVSDGRGKLFAGSNLVAASARTSRSSLRLRDRHEAPQRGQARTQLSQFLFAELFGAACYDRKR